MEANFSRRLLVRDENGDERQMLLMAPTVLSPGTRHGDASLLRPLLVRPFQGPPQDNMVGHGIAVHVMEGQNGEKMWRYPASTQFVALDFAPTVHEGKKR